MELTISDPARDLIRRRGGHVFLWQRRVGSKWLADKVSYRPPGDIAFVRVDETDAINVWVPVDLSLPERLTISTKRLLRWRLRILLDGEVWGDRGGTY